MGGALIKSVAWFFRISFYGSVLHPTKKGICCHKVYSLCWTLSSAKFAGKDYLFAGKYWLPILGMRKVNFGKMLEVWVLEFFIFSI